MLDVLILRLEAPLMSFGGVLVDNHGVSRPLPGRAMLAGLCGNALGYEHGEADKLHALQRRIRYAARVDRKGRSLVDYHTVDLGQDFMTETAWTTRGMIEERKGQSGEGTHIRYRHFIADGAVTVVLSLVPPEAEPSVDSLELALKQPHRPLFIGRKACIPSVPIVLGRGRWGTLREALRQAPRHARADAGPVLGWWPAEEATEQDQGRKLPITDDRDWTNQIHVGRRYMFEGTVEVEHA